MQTEAGMHAEIRCRQRFNWSVGVTISLPGQVSLTYGGTMEEVKQGSRAAQERADIRRQLAERDIDLASIVKQAGQPDAATLDRLGHMPFNSPVPIHHRCSDRLGKQPARLNRLEPGARGTLHDLTGNYHSRMRTACAGASVSRLRWERHYASNGEFQFKLIDDLRLAPSSRDDNLLKILGNFCGADPRSTAFHQLQSLPYSAWL